MLPLPLLLFPMEAGFLIDGELWAALWPFRLKVLRSSAKADSTLRSSRAVPHPSTNRALRRLTSEVGRDPVYSTRYGRQRTPHFTLHQMEGYQQNRSETEKISKHANLLCLTPILRNFKIKNLRCAPGESNRGQKGLHCCNSPTCTLSQNGYGDPCR